MLLKLIFNRTMPNDILYWMNLVNNPNCYFCNNLQFFMLYISKVLFVENVRFRTMELSYCVRVKIQSQQTLFSTNTKGGMTLDFLLKWLE